MAQISQEEIDKIQKEQRFLFGQARDSWEIQKKRKVWDYGCIALKKREQEYNRTAKPFDAYYLPYAFNFQYDLEVDIFLNYDELRQECIELDRPNKVIYEQLGPTKMTREEHLLNAISIRWPTRILANGNHSGLLVRNPWLEDEVESICHYQDGVNFGGGGQGKTYSFLGLQCILFDHFIMTRSGAQCTYSTVSESKMKASTWPYVNKLYPVDRKFSMYAGRAQAAPDFTFKRLGLDGKEFRQGGKFVGILLTKGAQDSRVVDKLTGSHDPIARSYMLDEAQATDGAPLTAYTNMFLHPKYKWFRMSGNYEKQGDLLDINVEPNVGWNNVTESTHKWEGTLKSPESNLDRVTQVIHFNNELSPGMTPEGARKWPFLPNQRKRDDLYKTEESKKQYGYKRFWVGFRFEKEEKGANELVLTSELIADTGCHLKKSFLREPIKIASFDSAPASKDRNLFLSADVGFDYNNGYPLIQMGQVEAIKKSTNQQRYYKETTKQILDLMGKYNVTSGHIIMDWSSKPALIEMLNDAGIVCHFIFYHGKIPKKPGISEVDGSQEDAIPLETIKSMENGRQIMKTIMAHEKVANSQTLGAYVMRLFVENGRVGNFNASIIENMLPNHGWEKEMLRRKFVSNIKGLLNLDDKDEFIAKYHFSTDVFDICFQLFYMLYVKFNIRPNEIHLGTLGEQRMKKPILPKVVDLFKLRIGGF